MLRKRAFTLIELMVVIAIIGVLAALLTPQVSNMINNSRIAQAAADFRAIESAGNRMFMDLGVYPQEGAWCVGGSGGGSAGDGAAFTRRAAVPAQYQDLWNGPYLKTWPKQHPFGGCVTYLQQRCGNCFDVNGISNDEAYAHYFDGSPFTSSIKQKIDKILDDGNTATGVVKEIRSGLAYFIGEGPVW